MSFSGEAEANMQLDVRLPIGLLFSVLGALLTGFGLMANKSTLDHSLGLNINLWWGMLVFGIVMVLWAGAEQRLRG